MGWALVAISLAHSLHTQVILLCDVTHHLTPPIHTLKFATHYIINYLKKVIENE